jgi:hypothetical protein
LLGFIRPNRDFSTSYADSKLKNRSRLRFCARCLKPIPCSLPRGAALNPAIAKMVTHNSVFRKEMQENDAPLAFQKAALGLAARSS